METIWDFLLSITIYCINRLHGNYIYNLLGILLTYPYHLSNGNFFHTCLLQPHGTYLRIN